ncbi:MAG TPA: T9SS type A sorting domain-containing protein [Chitinophagaceae bacterium]|nr:T9SS type A sorting domain-containing protein [Chitinophagaceae bacterium]
MKINSTLSNLKNSSLLFGLAVLLGSTQSCTVTENTNTSASKKARISRKEKDVKIYPDLLKKVLHVRNVETTEVDFFVFDTQGTIMVHYKMNEKDHKKINGLEKGSYTYQVFKNDEMTKSGKIIIK